MKKLICFVIVGLLAAPLAWGEIETGKQVFYQCDIELSKADQLVTPEPIALRTWIDWGGSGTFTPGNSSNCRSLSWRSLGVSSQDLLIPEEGGTYLDFCYVMSDAFINDDGSQAEGHRGGLRLGVVRRVTNDIFAADFHKMTYIYQEYAVTFGSFEYDFMFEDYTGTAACAPVIE